MVPPATPTPAPPGPVDRVGFLAEQRRRRRQGGLLTLVCAAAITITGAPLALFLTPLLFALAVLALRLVPGGLVHDQLRDALIRFGSALPRAADAVLNQKAPTSTDWLSAAGAVGLTLVPGFAAALAVWLVLRAAFLRSGAGGMLLALGARPPQPTELGEHRLENVVAEIAISAAVPAPRIMVLDDDAANAAVIGCRPEDATLLVTTGLLRDTSRDALQAIVAHLVASAANGDLRLALSILSSFAALGFLASAFDAAGLFSPSAARDVRRTLRWVVLPPRDDAVEAARIEEVLEADIDVIPDDALFGLVRRSGTGDRGDAPAPPSRAERLGRALTRLPVLGKALRGLFLVLAFPFLLLAIPIMLARIPLLLLRALVAAPLVALAWRSRRYLADATAVQLTRNPDGLAAALVTLAGRATSVPGGEWADYVFVVTEGGGGARAGTRRAIAPGIAHPHPSVSRRLRRLEAMGARPAPGTGGSARHMPWVVYAVLAPLLAIVVGLLAFALVLAVGLGVGVPLTVVSAILEGLVGRVR